MKRWKMIAATATLGAIVACPAYADTTIYYDHEVLNTQKPVVNVDSRIMVAMRDLFENLNATVDWNDSIREASITYRDMELKMYPDSGAVLLNGQPQALDVRPQMIDNHVYLPLRFVAQSIGGTVDYTELMDGNSIVEIHTMDSAENFETQLGNVTRIVRNASNPVNTIAPTAATQAAYDNWKNHNVVYYCDSKGNIVELQSYDKTLHAAVTDLMRKNTKDSVGEAQQLYTALGKARTVDGKTVVPLNPVENHQYLGTGTPKDLTKFTVLSKENKYNYNVYESTATTTVAQVHPDTNEIEVKDITENGLVLSYNYTDPVHALYANADDNSYTFFVDGNLMIVTESTSTILETEEVKDIRALQMYTAGDQYIVSYINYVGEYPELYLIKYNPKNYENIVYKNISMLSVPEEEGEKIYPYSSLDLVDAMVKEDTYYAFIKTNMDYYVVSYNYVTDKSTKVRLGNKERVYTQLLDTKDGVKLLSVDADYYYLRDVK